MDSALSQEGDGGDKMSLSLFFFPKTFYFVLEGFPW